MMFFPHCLRRQHFLRSESGRLQHPATTAQPYLVATGETDAVNRDAIDAGFKGFIELSEHQFTVRLQTDFRVPGGDVFLFDAQVASRCAANNSPWSQSK